jgi:hypothetical protein
MLIRYSWGRRRNLNACSRIKVNCVMKNILFLLCTILLFNFDKPRDPILLQHGIEKMIWGAKDVYSLPHYLLIDKHGALIAKILPQPSEQDLLYNALDSARQH